MGVFAPIEATVEEGKAHTLKLAKEICAQGAHKFVKKMVGKRKRRRRMSKMTGTGKARRVYIQHTTLFSINRKYLVVTSYQSNACLCFKRATLMAILTLVETVAWSQYLPVTVFS